MLYLNNKTESIEEKEKVSHKQIVKVYHADTDCYNVVWHGSYIKWFEIGRVELVNLAKLDIESLEKDQGVTFPVIELNIKYKNAAKLYDELLIESSINNISKLSIDFSHKVTNNKTKQTIVIANAKIVVLKEAKLLRKIPEDIYEAFSNLVVD